MMVSSHIIPRRGDVLIFVPGAYESHGGPWPVIGQEVGTPMRFWMMLAALSCARRFTDFET